MTVEYLIQGLDTMPTDKLVKLQTAFELEKADAPGPRGVAFCEDALAAIANVLKTREPA